MTTADILQHVRAFGHPPGHLHRYVLQQHGVTVWGQFRQALREYIVRRDGRPVDTSEVSGIEVFEAAAQELWSKLQSTYGLQALFDPEFQNQLSEEAECARMLREALVDLVAHGRFSAGTVSAMSLFPEWAYKATIALINPLCAAPNLGVAGAAELLRCFDIACQQTVDFKQTLTVSLPGIVAGMIERQSMLALARTARPE
jgi:hypothetical protein